MACNMRALALLASLNLVACRPAGTTPAEAVTGPGRYEQTMTVDGNDRRYTLVVPRGYSPDKQVPLIVLLHGYGSNANQITAYSRLGALADTEGFVLAVPSGMGRVNGWNCGFVNMGARGVDDVKFIGTLISKLKGELAIDSKRVFVAGHSNGAMLSYAVGSALSDKVAAIGVVEGSNAIDRPTLKRAVPAPEEPVSAIVFHGRNDRLVPYEPANGRLGLYLGAVGAASLWARGDGIAGEPRRATIGSVGSLMTWSGDGVDVELVTVDAGNHMWPGAPGSSGNAIDATNLMLDFFKTHAKR